MATVNPFDLLGADDSEDPSLLIAAQQLKVEPKKTVAGGAPAKPATKAAAAQAKLPSKPLPPAEAVRESKFDFGQGGRGGRGYTRGRGTSGGSYRERDNYENSQGNREISGARNEADGERPYERRGGYGGPRGSFRGGRRGGFSNGEVGEEDRPRRTFDRRSGTGQGYETKREGAGRGNWGTQTDELAPVSEDIVAEAEKGLIAEKPTGEEEVAADGDKEAAKNDVDEKVPEEDKEMTLEEYEKVLEEKRKALQALKTESSRKVDVKEFETMQQLSNKKTNDDVFIKLGSEKDKKKELAEKEERAKKSVNINEFLKPAEGERYFAGGRGRGRGRGSRGGYSGGFETSSVRAPAIEDPKQFPTLGGK